MREAIRADRLRAKSGRVSRRLGQRGGQCEAGVQRVGVGWKDARHVVTAQVKPGRADPLLASEDLDCHHCAERYRPSNE